MCKYIYIYIYECIYIIYIYISNICVQIILYITHIKYLVPNAIQSRDGKESHSTSVRVDF